MNAPKYSAEALSVLAAQASAVSGPYITLAKSIATAMTAAGVKAEASKEGRKTVWNAFKDALTIASTNGHNVSTLRVGLEIACSEAGIPAGSFRSYLGTTANLYSDVTEGKLTLADAQGMTIKDARDRYKPEPSEADKLRSRLHEAVKAYDEEQMRLVLDILEINPSGEEKKETESKQEEKQALAA